MDNTIAARVKRLLRRRRFAVLGYSAEDETYCPQCLRLATGLSPQGVDTNGKPVLALYACDPTMHEEVCSNCHQRLVDLVPGLQPTLQLRVYRRVCEAGTTIVKSVPIGTMLLHGDGRGVLFTNMFNEPFEIFPGESRAEEITFTPTANPPVIRRRASCSQVRSRRSESR
jgi:hypothetical protein